MSEKKLTLKNLIESGDCVRIIKYCEDKEIDLVPGVEVDVKLPKHFYTAYLLSYLVVGDLDNARFLWKRTPKNFKKGVELAAVWDLGKHMWLKNHSNVFKKIEQVSWSGEMVPLIELLVTHYRNRILGLVAKAYSCVKITDVSNYIGLPPDQTEKMLTKAGWVKDDIYFRPVEVKLEKTTDTIKGLELVQDLAKKHVFLELNNDKE